MVNYGRFVISLDTELYWGIRDRFTPEQYGKNIKGVWQIIPKLLEIFDEFDIHVSFAVVGMMACENREDLINNNPSRLVDYTIKEYSPYLYIQENQKLDKKYHFGLELIQQIRQNPKHEIGSHTYSHFYCLDDGQSITDFELDCLAHNKLFHKLGLETKSFVFPRHQINSEYLTTLLKYGFTNYRETETAWYHSPAKSGKESILKRAVRFADYYFNPLNHHTSEVGYQAVDGQRLYYVRASRVLRPYIPKWALLENLRLHRIKSQMTAAAKSNKIFHLWWHPHDFGINQNRNLLFLRRVLIHYQYLNKKYGMQSMHMSECVEDFIEKQKHNENG